MTQARTKPGVDASGGYPRAVRLRAGASPGCMPGESRCTRCAGMLPLEFGRGELVENKPVFAPPKRGKTRTVPLSARVARELDEYAERFEPATLTLPWLHPGRRAHHGARVPGRL